jgi:signal transduction histidine kinase/DNA-binding NarL/FixJ family response regulator
MSALSSFDPLRVLVLDDDALDRMAAVRALRQLEERPKFEEADCADAAFAKLREGAYDLVLIDYMLGDSTALDLLPSLRREFPDCTIIVLTGHTEASIAVELMKAGASDFISKDELSPDTLERSIRHAMRLKASERALAHLEAERRRYQERLNELVTGASSIVGELSGERVLVAAAERAVLVLGGSRSCVAYVDQAGARHVHTHAARGGAEVAEGFWDRVWSEFRDVRLPTVRSRAEEPALFADGPASTSLLVVPLPRQDAVRGGFVAVVREDDASWRDSDVPLLTQLSQLTAVSLENARSYQIAQRAVQTREEVLAVVSHDLRAPLSNVRIATTILRDLVRAGSEAASVVQRIDRTTAHMARLVDDLLEVSRLEAGTFRIDPRPEPVTSLVEAAAQLARPLADAAVVDFVIASPTGSIEVLADRTRVLQALSNLLANAFKFTPQGGRVRLSAELHERAARFYVSDTGPGIPDDIRAHVFDRFWQAQTPQRTQGAGLGLYIAREVVIAHGGTMIVESKPGGGTTFSFSLPFA